MKQFPAFSALAATAVVLPAGCSPSLEERTPTFVRDLLLRAAAAFVL